MASSSAIRRKGFWLHVVLLAFDDSASLPEARFEQSACSCGACPFSLLSVDHWLSQASNDDDGEDPCVSILMTHDVCGSGMFGIFKKEFGQNAKVWDREKIPVMPDHYIFTSDKRANRNTLANPDYKGVCHIALAQEGHCRPREVLLGTDSHTCNAGAFGQFATGIGNTDAGFVMGTGKLLLKMEERMTLCHMVIKAGGKNAVVAADETTFKYLEDKTSKNFEPLFIQEYKINVSKLEPLVAKPHSPDNRALATECKYIKIDRAYIGSCTGGKMEDFLAAAKVFLASIASQYQDLPGRLVLKCLRRLVVKFQLALVVQLTWLVLQKHAWINIPQVCVSTTNRNFHGRMVHQEEGTKSTEFYCFPDYFDHRQHLRKSFICTQQVIPVRGKKKSRAASKPLQIMASVLPFSSVLLSELESLMELFGLHGVRRVTVAMGAINLVEATSGAALMGVMQQRRWCGAREMTAVGLTSSLAVARIAAMVAMAVAQELTAITIDATDEASLEDDFFRRERRVRGLQFFLK
ncbi:hypothetical protein OPV22_022875 [Ensete ventricosum]|uniref:Aconitase/3-isopropylmalate dehydratase large subunit alpha/beta/alpha domain-containing protein n=1 Tax=Ensete ventricosum TaxID=4639 RepID=A0AAV8QPF3_ENSVE|nr:hypothetical protein OPV22_022875 [Ensete ventricosum]